MDNNINLNSSIISSIYSNKKTTSLNTCNNNFNTNSILNKDKSQSLLGNKRISLSRKFIKVITNKYYLETKISMLTLYDIEIENSFIQEGDINFFIKNITDKPLIKFLLSGYFENYFIRGRRMFSYTISDKGIKEKHKLNKRCNIYFLLNNENTYNSSDNSELDLKLIQTKEEISCYKDKINFYKLTLNLKHRIKIPEDQSLIKFILNSNSYDYDDLNNFIMSNLSLNENNKSDSLNCLSSISKFNEFVFNKDKDHIIHQFYSCLFRFLLENKGLNNTYNRGNKRIITTNNVIQTFNREDINKTDPINFVLSYKTSVSTKINNFPIITLNTFYSMQRKLTLYHYFNYFQQDFDRFKLYFNNIKGVTIHIKEIINIDNIIYQDLSKVKFNLEKNKDKQIDVYSYLLCRYSKFFELNNITLIKEQPILLCKKKHKYLENTGNEQLEYKIKETINYYPSQLVCPKGKLIRDDNNLNKITICKPYQKYNFLVDIVNKLNKEADHIDNYMIFDKIKLHQISLNAHVIPRPSLIINDKQIYKINKLGNLYFPDIAPLENQKITKNICVIFIGFLVDLEENIILNFVNNINKSFVSKEMNANISKENVLRYPNNKDLNFNDLGVKEYISNFYEHIAQHKQLKKTNIYDIVITVFKSNYLCKQYKKTVKLEYFRRFKTLKDMTNQCCVFENLCKNNKTDFSAFTLMAFHIWSKSDIKLWSINVAEAFDNDELKYLYNNNCILGAYCVSNSNYGKDSDLNSTKTNTENNNFDNSSDYSDINTCTTLVIDYDFLNSYNINLQKYYNKYDLNYNKLSTTIDKLINMSVKYYYNFFSDTKKDNIIKNVILYREYNQDIKLIIEFEVAKIEEEILDISKKHNSNVEINLIIVFVNKNRTLNIFSKQDDVDYYYQNEFSCNNDSICNTGIEFINASFNKNKNSYYINNNNNNNNNLSNINNTENYSIISPPLGTVINSCITNESNNFKAFYLVNSNNEKATQFLIYSKNTDVLNNNTLVNIIIKESYYQSFKEQGSFKCLKIPALLHQAFNMNKFNVNYLDNKTTPRKSNYYYSL